MKPAGWSERNGAARALWRPVMFAVPIMFSIHNVVFMFLIHTTRVFAMSLTVMPFQCLRPLPARPHVEALCCKVRGHFAVDWSPAVVFADAASQLDGVHTPYARLLQKPPGLGKCQTSLFLFLIIIILSWSPHLLQPP
jgi:hypothetical protein